MSIIERVNVGGIDSDIRDTSTRNLVSDTEDTSFASRDYSKDETFIWFDGNIYRATVPIAQNAKFIVGTNVTIDKNLGKALSNVSNSFDQRLANEVDERNNAISGAITRESGARSAADTNLQAQIDELIAPTGAAPSAAEIENARIAADSTVFKTLGDAIRTQVGDLKVQRKEFLVLKSDWASVLTSNSDSSIWVSDKIYKPGYITDVEVSVNSNTNQECYIQIYKKITNKTGTLIYQSPSVYGHGTVVIPVNYLVECDFFLAVKGSSIRYGDISDGLWVTASVTGTDIDLSSSTYHYYHAYEIHMLDFCDLLNEVYSKNQYAVEQADGYITNSSDILAATPNRIYVVTNDLNWASLGFPAPGPATFIKLSPMANVSTTGYCVFLYCNYLSATDTNLYFAFGVMDQTLSALNWHRLSDSNNTISIMGSSDYVTAQYMTNHGYASIVDLPHNKAYLLDPLPISYGVPVSGYATLMKYSGHFTSESTTGFTVYLYSVLVDGHTEFYYAFAGNNQVISDLSWIRLGDKNRGIQKIGLANKTIGFIGDSIVEGYGSSDYNGGASGTSGHAIPNNVKTWYRNTGVQCWANKLMQYIGNKYSNTTCFNNAIGGFTTKNVHDNLNTLARDDYGNLANVIVLMVGTNDMSSNDKVGNITFYLIKIIKWLQFRGIQPIILTNTPTIGTSKPNNSETVQSAIKLACDQAGVPCYDLLSEINYHMWDHNIALSASTDQTKFMYDNLHPANPGHAIIYELVKRILCL